LLPYSSHVQNLLFLKYTISQISYSINYHKVQRFQKSILSVIFFVFQVVRAKINDEIEKSLERDQGRVKNLDRIGGFSPWSEFSDAGNCAKRIRNIKCPHIKKSLYRNFSTPCDLASDLPK